jgi:hypothetical protein
MSEFINTSKKHFDSKSDEKVVFEVVEQLHDKSSKLSSVLSLQNI